jgi:hypothetical protein
MRTRQTRTGGGKVENDFEPNKMVDENNQNLDEIHREVIYDQNQALKDRNGQMKNIRYSGNDRKPEDQGKDNKSYSVSTKIEHRTIHRTIGDDGTENFGSSKSHLKFNKKTMEN